ncbi:MAG: alpha/beta hydrolase [Polyangia bacterium]
MNTRQFSAADGTRLCADVYFAKGFAKGFANGVANGEDGASGADGPAPARGGSAADPTPEPATGAPAGSGLRGAAGSRGTVVIVHGYCEHRGRYRHVAEHLNRSGYDVLVGDLRGHGGSEGERGFVWRFSDYSDDVAAFLREAAQVFADKNKDGNKEGGAEPAQRPILLGHSMGGLVALQFALANPKALRALVLSSPFLGLKLRVPGWKRTMAQLASLLRPKLRLPNELPPSGLSHDEAVCRAYATDPLVTHDATARWFTETLSAQADTLERAGQVKVPTLMLHAGDDHIVDAEVSKAVFSRIGAADKSMTFYPGLYHEIFNELEKDRVLGDLTTWLASH